MIRLPWKAKEIAAAVGRYEALLPSYAWRNWVLGNHDKPRIATRGCSASLGRRDVAVDDKEPFLRGDEGAVLELA